MARRRIHLDLTAVSVGDLLELPEDRAHYLSDVLRLESGAELEVFDGDGTAFAARMEGRSEIVLVRRLERDVESPCSITLYQAIAKGDRFEWVLEKATELGVARIVPLETARTIVRIKPQKHEAKLERWSRICASAARQCGRTVVPEVTMPSTIGQLIDASSRGVEFILSPRADIALRAALEAVPEAIGVWVGPEGGFAPDELDAISTRATSVRFGPRVLRSETAGIAALTAIQLLTGGLE